MQLTLPRAAGGTRYVHLACTRYLTCMHTGDRSAEAIDAGESALDPAVLDNLVTRYQALAAAGLAANFYRRTVTAKDARRPARRFRTFEDMILRFATRPDLDIFSNNEAEWGISKTRRPPQPVQRPAMAPR